MIKVGDWLDKVQADLAISAPEVKSIGFARDLSNLRTGKPKSLPAVYVLPLSESARPIDSTQQSGDYVEMEVEIVYIASDMAHDEGDSLSDIREDVHASLLGWQPSGSVYPAHFRRGSRVGYTKGMISWSDVFKIDFVRTNNA